MFASSQSKPTDPKNNTALQNKLTSWMSILSKCGHCVVFSYDNLEWQFNEAAVAYFETNTRPKDMHRWLKEHAEQNGSNIWIWRAENTTTQSEIGSLTSKETIVLQHLKSGNSNLEISNILSLKVRTVEKHIENIFKKLKINRRNEILKIR